MTSDAILSIIRKLRGFRESVYDFHTYETQRLSHCEQLDAINRPGNIHDLHKTASPEFSITIGYHNDNRSSCLNRVNYLAGLLNELDADITKLERLHKANCAYV